MPDPHTLDQTITDIGGEWMNFGPPADDASIRIAETFGAYEAEYAAIRQRVAILHLPQRGILRFTGKDCKDFLHRMVTQDIRAMKGGQSRRTFQLNNKGRIVADGIIHHGDCDTWFELDTFDLPAVKELLEARLFTEDVTIEDYTPQRTILALLGPAAQALLNAVMDDPIAEWESPYRDRIAEMPGTHHVVSLAGSPVSVYRWDDCGVLGLRLAVRREEAASLYPKLLAAAGYKPHAEADPEYALARRQSLRGRPIGWLAYNTARIEAGSPLFHIDFGPDSLPAETGLLEQAVSFKKGCYPGQEIVARMKNLGHPKRVLVGLKFTDDNLPFAGSQVFAQRDGKADPSAIIGGITSSTISPMLSRAPIAFAVVKWDEHDFGRTLYALCEGKLCPATVHPLKFL